jgi:hypothetical protein
VLGDHPSVIRNVILHLNNEQPLLADLYEAPSPGDVGLRCTNLRMMNGKRPVFVREGGSIGMVSVADDFFVAVTPSGHAACVGSDDAPRDSTNVINTSRNA